MESFVITTDINIDDVTVYQRSGVWNSVTDDFIDGGAAASWVLVVV